MKFTNSPFAILDKNMNALDYQKRSHTVEVQIAMGYKRIENLSAHLQSHFTNKNVIVK